MLAKDRVRGARQAEAARAVAQVEHGGLRPFELAGAIGNAGMQRIARSPELRRSRAAAAFVSGGRATLSRRMGGDEEIAEGLGVPDAMEEWLWQQQGMAEEHARREEELLKYLETRWERDDELPRDDELRRRGVFHPPPVLGY